MAKLRALALIIVLAKIATLSTPAVAATLPTTSATWPAQMKAAKPGDTLVLTGTFSTLLKIDGRDGLTIDATAANLSGLLIKGGSTNITVQGGTYRPIGSYGGVFAVDSSKVNVRDVSIVDTGLWPGVTFRNASDVTLTGARIDRAKIGVYLQSVTRASLRDLTLLSYAVDGLDIAASHNVVAEYVTCAGAQLVDDHHPDCAQLMGTLPGAEPTSSVVFRYFQVSGATQGIGGYDHGTGGFRNITMENNVLAISYPQALPLNAAPGSIVRNNVVRTLPGSAFRSTINVDATVTRCGNVVAPGANRVGTVDSPC